MMMSQVIRAQAPSGGRYVKTQTTPQSPLVPLIHSRTAKAAFRRNAFSLWSPDAVPQGPFSFLPPDVPAPRKHAAMKAPIPADSLPLLPEDKSAKIEFRPNNTGSPVPRFRSALEQVSYFTNESAWKGQ